MTDLKVSVITPNYNYAHFIEKTLSSVRDQTYVPIEHVVVDDGSTDRSIEVIKKFEGEYDLKWIAQPNRGQVSAYNRAIGMASGDWILCLNSDDYLLDNMVVERMIRTMNDKPGFSIYMGNVWHVDVFGNRRGQFDHCGLSVLDHNTLLNVYGLCIHQATFVHRKVYDKVGLFSERFRLHMDYEFLLRATQFFQVRLVDAYVSAMRVHERARTQQPGFRSAFELFRARQLYGGAFFHYWNIGAIKALIQHSIPYPVRHLVTRVPFFDHLLEKWGWRRLGLCPFNSDESDDSSS